MGNGSLIGKACCWVSSLTVSFVMNWRLVFLAPSFTRLRVGLPCFGF